jgi:KamA family protein
MITPLKLKIYSIKDIDKIPQLSYLNDEERFRLKVAAQILPFRTNNYVIEQLIDWDNIPDDPIFLLNFLQGEMIGEENFERIYYSIKNNLPADEIQKVVASIRENLNPHPAGQMDLNVPVMDEELIPGVQHKYRETCLIFPSAGQTCHAYCTFCFRWPQFIGNSDVKFATDESKKFQQYIKEHKEITNILITGGDPMIMSAANLREYIAPLLGEDFSHTHSIRIGTKALSYWPYRFISDKDSDDILRLFETVVKSGKHLSIMAHFNHWREMETEAAQEAIRRVRDTGAEIRTQSPLLRHINDDAGVWVKMWRRQVALGCIPYYMFIERNTGATDFFEVPLWKSFEIFRDAFNQVSGLSRTVRGPSMSALPGKVSIDGITEIMNEKVFVLTFLQGRNPDWCKRPFFAKYDEEATWLTDLKPAFGDEKFFYQDEMNELSEKKQGSMYFFTEPEDYSFPSNC